MERQKDLSIFQPAFIAPSARRAVLRLSPQAMMGNPVMFVAWLGALVTSVESVRVIATGGEGLVFVLAVTIFLWLTVWFANFAESLAEARGRAQADTLRSARQDVMATKLASADRSAARSEVPGGSLRKGDIVIVEAGGVIPADGEIIEGVASVDESAVTGESAPVIRESGGDRSAVTGGTRVLSDWIIVTVTADPGEAFLDRMISMVEGATRQKTPNEIALTIVLAGFTLAFLLVCVTLYPIGAYFDTRIDVVTLVALLVCLIPTTIGALLSAIGIAGMTRLGASNVVAMSGRAVEAAGDVDVLLLDKTGTITLGNRRATAFVPAAGVDESAVAEGAQLASLADETPEGRSIVVLAKEKHGLRGRDLQQEGARFIPFSAETRMSGVDVQGRKIRKGALEAIRAFIESHAGTLDPGVARAADEIAAAGGTPLVVAEVVNGTARALGVVHLKDIVKGGIRERFAELRKMGIKTVMITGDNPKTAAAIAAEAGVDDFLAEATPEAKLRLIREYQAKGHLVAMTGDGTNDAPALAQADVAVAMQTGTQAAKEAGNMVDLDSNPTKLIDIVGVGKQMLMTRGSLTTFSIANDVAKYFAIIPAIFVVALPQLAPLNIMGLESPRSAILSAVIFNAIVIPALIPIAMRGVEYKPVSADALLRRNLLIYGLGGLIVPFLGIKLIDFAVAGIGLA
ncbi:MAG: potassium-transporting ATPase subunit KdpB [Phycisphaerales bacterium]|nr:potassium-transporting ATPase subunit KdpB [Phycisphaerales bacterium]